MKHHPANQIQDFRPFGEFGGVNPSVTDSSTFTFLNPETMEALFDHEIEGCFLYSRHWNPSNKYLSEALRRMEGSEAALVTGSGMAAISSAVLQICGKGQHIVASRTIYGGTYALFKNVLPRFGISVSFVNLQDITAVRSAIRPETRLIYGESISNPLLEVADIPALSGLAHDHGLQLMIDNTFSPMVLSPIKSGADVVVHSLTKFINGTSDCVAGAVCGSSELIASMMDVNSGIAMLLGPVLDSYRAASILKNLHTLHIRMQRHSRNAQRLAEALAGDGYRVFYPGLPKHPQHRLIKRLFNAEYGFGGILAVDLGTTENANRAMMAMQEEMVGYLAVSLGYFKTLFSAPGHSTSSEIPAEEQLQMGLSEGLVRISVGLDEDIERTIHRVRRALEHAGVKMPANE